MGHKLIGEMHRYRLVAVVRTKTAEEAMATVNAVAEGGVKFIEITLTIPGALEVVEELTQRSNLTVGAGTVLTKEEAEKAIAAGARFVVSPTLELNLIPICRGSDVACVSGAATPTEIGAAMRAGADLVKIFPADCMGGPNFVRQVLGPFPSLRTMVSGGVDQRNVKEYVELGVTGLVLGSPLLRSLWSEGGHAEVVRQVGHFVKLVDEAQVVSTV